MHGDTEPNAQTICIAVLPFESLSNSREHDYFSSGFVEDLSLSSQTQLQRQFRDGEKPGRRCGVAQADHRDNQNFLG